MAGCYTYTPQGSVWFDIDSALALLERIAEGDAGAREADDFVRDFRCDSCGSLRDHKNWCDQYIEEDE